MRIDCGLSVAATSGELWGPLQTATVACTSTANFFGGAAILTMPSLVGAVSADWLCGLAAGDVRDELESCCAGDLFQHAHDVHGQTAAARSIPDITAT